MTALARLARLGVHTNEWPGEAEVAVVEVTPAVARQLLATAEPWRTERARPDLVRRYADLMRADRWSLTGDTLKVNTSGRLIDGTHRLSAVVLAGWCGPMAVAVGVPDAAAYDMDPPGQLDWNEALAVVPRFGRYGVTHCPP